MVMRKIRSQVKIVMWITIIGFAGWIIFDLGANLMVKGKGKPWQKGVIGEIDNKKISSKMFYREYQNVLQDSLKNVGGRELSDQEEKSIRDEAWKKMITNLRWSELSNKRHIRLLDETYLTVMERVPPTELQKDTALYTNNKFDINKYRQALGNPRNAGYFANYEMKLRREIPKDINTLDVLYAFNISNKELEFMYGKDYAARKAKYLLVKYNQIPDSSVKVSDKELDEYYRKNREKFRRPATIQILSVRFPILPEKADSVDAEDRLSDAKYELSQGTPFDSTAIFYSDDETRENGGDAGWVKAEDRRFALLYKMLKDAPFDSIIGPVLLPDGYYLAKKTKMADDSMHIFIIQSKVKVSEATRDEVKDRVRDFVDRAKEEGFQEVANRDSLKVIDSHEIPMDAPFIRGVGRTTADISTMIKAMKVGKISDPIPQSNSFVVFFVKDKKKSYIPKLSDIKKVVMAKLQKEKKLDVSYAVAKKAYKVFNSVKDSTAFEKAKESIKDYNPIVTETRYFTRGSLIDYNVGYSPLFKSTAFSLKEGDVSDVLKDKRVGSYFLQITGVRVPDTNKSIIQMATARKKYNLNRTIEEDFTNEMTSDKNVKDYRKYFYGD